MTQLEIDVRSAVAAGTCTIQDREDAGVWAVFTIPAIPQAPETSQMQMGNQYNRRPAIAASTAEIRLDVPSTPNESAWYADLLS
jgi:hypothetical protein